MIPFEEHGNIFETLLRLISDTPQKLPLRRLDPLIGIKEIRRAKVIYKQNTKNKEGVGALIKVLERGQRRENGIFPYELAVPGFFTHELLSHAKNHMNNGKMTYFPMN